MTFLRQVYIAYLSKTQIRNALVFFWIPLNWIINPFHAQVRIQVSNLILLVLQSWYVGLLSAKIQNSIWNSIQNSIWKKRILFYFLKFFLGTTIEEDKNDAETHHWILNTERTTSINCWRITPIFTTMGSSGFSTGLTSALKYHRNFEFYKSQKNIYYLMLLKDRFVQFGFSFRCLG